MKDDLSSASIEPLLYYFDRLEVFGDLHEYGALGKTITAKEVDKLLNLKATI